jgi:murein DD-endopeptidase MepM/ murein hydrolase activator NlpD
VNVIPGQRVKAGEVIGYLGSTGRSTGPHVHYEIRKDGVDIDPYPFLKIF